MATEHKHRISEPYTLHIFVVDGDPDGVKIVNRQNWTGCCIAFPRTAWKKISGREEFRFPGVYILSGYKENSQNELPTVYVGQGDEIFSRIDSHYDEKVGKDFWDWGYAFVSKGTALNRAHTTWLEHALIDRAGEAEQCNLDNNQRPKEPQLSEWERADTKGFLNEMLRILPLLGMRAFEKPKPVDVADLVLPEPINEPQKDIRDTIVVPAQLEGFKRVFLGEHCWYEVRISGGMLQKIKFIAAYQTAPISKITHFASVKSIEPYGESGKYRLIFAKPAEELPKPIPLGNAHGSTLMGPRYTNMKKLLTAASVAELLNNS